MKVLNLKTNIETFTINKFKKINILFLFNINEQIV
jgi:hypothetical protein